MDVFKVFLLFVMNISMNLSLESSCETESGLTGTCKPITECLFLTEMLNAGDLSDLTSCDSDGTVGVFCCPLNQLNSTQPIVSGSCRKNLDLKQQLMPKFKDYDVKSPSMSVRKLPHMVQVLFPEKGFVGAGALISEKFVLTSARVVFVRRSMPIIRLGKTTLDGEDGSIGLDVAVKQVIPHELFTPREMLYDIALLLLKRPVKFYSHIWPACLHSSKMILDDQQVFTLAGWKSNGRKTNSLTRNKLVPVLSSGCKKFYDDDKFKVSMPNGVSDGMFCANFTDCSNGADSDGPVFIQVNGTFFIYAFATVESHCRSTRPGLYSKVSDAAEWIENVISQ